MDDPLGYTVTTGWPELCTLARICIFRPEYGLLKTLGICIMHDNNYYSALYYLEVARIMFVKNAH